MMEKSKFPKSENRKIEIQHYPSFYFLLYNNILNDFITLKYELLNSVLSLKKVLRRIK